MSDAATPNLPSRDFEKTSQFYVALGGRASFALGVRHGRYAQSERRGQRNMSSYCRSSWRSSSLATPETVPVNSPVLAKKTGLFEASAKTGTFVSVNVRVPDASLKRPVPPVI